MKLLLPGLQNTIERSPLTCHRTGHPAFHGKPTDFVARVLPLLHRAEKFIFDSGSDQDHRTVHAVIETARNMVEAGLFHLPHPIIWVEDPFEEAPEMRYCYLCREEAGKITITALSVALGRVSVLLDDAVIDFSEPQDFFVKGMRSKPPGVIVDKTPFAMGSGDHDAYMGTMGEYIYSLKKFLVSLATEQVVLERVAGKPHAPGLPKKFRKYPHTIVRVPLDDTILVSSGTGVGGKMRKHLVRGYVWGKNTRPTSEQRWIKPFFRGNEELGTIDHHHYEVG